MARVFLDGVTKKFGETIAVKNLSLEVKKGEFMILLGPSGSGKTTTLRIIAGLEAPTEGAVYIDGKDVTYISPQERDVAMVFQSYALYPHMSVYDNIAFPLRMRKYSKDVITRKVMRVAKLLVIESLLKRKPRQLSGGEAQRVALGRAIVREPKVFLMDEPLSNLDAMLRVHMRAELKALQMKLKTTTIYVTHDQLEAMTMADRISLFNKGVLEQIGTGKDLFHHPKTLFAARFIGTPPMNFIDGSFLEEDDRAFIETEQFKLDISELRELIKKEATTSELIIGVRPEDISINMKQPHTYDAASKIFVVEPTGSEFIVNLKLGETLLKAKTGSDFTGKEGEKAWLTFNRNKIHIFDKKTQMSIV